MKIRYHFNALPLLVLLGAAAVTDAQVQPQLAQRWFCWPLYMLADKTDDERQRIMLHGLFHRIQPELGFTADNGFNEHLDTVEGRVWMQLEWRALRRALESSGSGRSEA